MSDEHHDDDEDEACERCQELVAEQAGLDRARLLKWILAYAGLGAAWSLDSGHDEDTRVGLAIAEIAAAELGLSSG